MSSVYNSSIMSTFSSENFQDNRRPYKTGLPCSRCPIGTECFHNSNLCCKYYSIELTWLIECVACINFVAYYDGTTFNGPGVEKGL